MIDLLTASIERLTATVELLRQRQDTVLLRAAYHAVFEQYCVISLEPVAGILEEEFALRYGPPEAEDAASDAAGEEEAFEPLSGDAIDIGEAVAQEFSLALPPFPRDPAAVIEVASDEFAPAYRDVPGSSEMPDEVAGDENRADNPFGALARWRK